MKKLMKMLVVALLCSVNSFAVVTVPQSKPVYLAVIVDASPTSEFKWGQIKLFAANSLHALNAGDRLEIYSARKNSSVLHTSSIIKHTSATTVIRCLDDIHKIFFLDKADVAKSAESVFETFKVSEKNFECCLLVISDGKMPDKQLRQIQRVFSAYKMRNWPVMFATFKDADKDIFRSGAKNEFTVTLIKDEGLKIWLDKIRNKPEPLKKIKPQTSSPVSKDSDVAPVSKPKQPKTPEKTPKIKLKTKSLEPVKSAPTASKIEKKDDTSAQSKQSNSDAFADIELKNQQTVTARIKSLKTPNLIKPALDPNTIKTDKQPVCDVNKAKTSVKKPEVKNTSVKNTESKELHSSKATDGNQPPKKTSKQGKASFNKRRLMAIPLLLLLIFVIYYIWQKMIASGSSKPFLTEDIPDNTNLKLMAAYNGVDYELGDTNTITNLEIGSHPGSSIPVDTDGSDERLFAIKARKGSFNIKNLSSEILTISAMPLAPKKKCNLILPADIRYGDKVNIQLYQLSPEDSNLQ